MKSKANYVSAGAHGTHAPAFKKGPNKTPPTGKVRLTLGLDPDLALTLQEMDEESTLSAITVRLLNYFVMGKGELK